MKVKQSWARYGLSSSDVAVVNPNIENLMVVKRSEDKVRNVEF